jgi:DNA processing protein
VTFLDTEYPSCFKQLDSPPPVLWANHPWKEWKWPAKRLAVIGSRKMSTYGRLISSQLVTELVADFAVSIISGCARGVDGQSHNSALLADGRTIGVLGCGLQAVTQREKRWLNEPRALIISEFPSRQAPQGWMFVQRNRLIAGAAQAVLVIEAQEKSGTLITVSAALEQGKEVLVVPQSLWNQNAGGIIHLANNGATLVRSAGEIMTQIWPESLVGEASSDSDLAKKSVNAPATAQAMLNLLKEHQGQLLLSDLLFKKPKLVSNTNWHSTLTYLEKVKKISCSYGVVRVL